MVLMKNRNFAVGVTLLLTQGTTYIGAVTYPTSTTPVSMSADTTLNLTVPNLPGQVNISGKVSDGSGNGVANVTVSATSQSITGAANVGFTGGGTTDANGNYVITVLSGTNYQVIFVPPTPTS